MLRSTAAVFAPLRTHPIGRLYLAGARRVLDELSR